MPTSLPLFCSLSFSRTLSAITFALICALPATAQTLFISEYIEGSSNNKAVEIFNPTGAAVDLADGGYQLQYYFNGNSAAGLTISLTGTISPGDVYVVAHSSADALILGEADQTSGSGWFNGDDAVVLRSALGAVDVIGQIGFDPGSQWGSGLTSTADNTLRRIASVCAGDVDGSDAFDPSVEFEGFPQDDFAGIGAHTPTCTGSPGNAAPVFTASLTSQRIPPGSPFNFDYEATDENSDTLTYSLITGPAGSTIDAATGLFAWTPTGAQAGSSFLVRVGVSDGTVTVTTEATLMVSQTVGDDPVFTVSFSGAIVASGQTITFDYGASDPDGGTVVYSLVKSPNGSIPAGAAIDSATGVLTFTPSSPGAYALTVRATDDETASTTTTAYVGAKGTLFPDLSGAALRSSLRSAYTPAQTLGYDTARDTMYLKIDRDMNGEVCGVYTGFCVSLPDGVDPSTFVFNGGINAEHTWPQSKGADDEPQRSDLHNLFPAKSNVNSARNNKPLGEVPDALAQTWYRFNQQQSAIPGSDIDEWSESASGRFEPREVHKGNAARAELYFFAIYESQSDEAFLIEQIDDLAAWNTLDTTDVAEVRRSYLIGVRQGNVNPFLFDPTLARRAYSDFLPDAVDCTDTTTTPTYAGGYVLNGDGSRAFVQIRVPAGGTSFEFYNTSNLVVGDPETRPESGVVVAGFTRSGSTFMFDPASPAQVFFPITTLSSTSSAVSFLLRVTDSCGRSVDVNPSFTLTGVESMETLVFALEGSAPNPVAETGTIRYSLDAPGQVSLTLYDVLGREVAVLVRAQMEAGWHTATVDVSALPSGLYIYRLNLGGKVLNRALTVAR